MLSSDISAPLLAIGIALLDAEDGIVAGYLQRFARSIARDTVKLLLVEILHVCCNAVLLSHDSFRAA